MLELKNITKEYNGNKAVNGVSFTVEKGQVVGFLGPNGAGKTTTMRMIAGVLEPTDGAVFFEGRNTQDDPLAIKRHLGYLPENNPLYEDMTVSEYLEILAELKGIRKADRKKAVHEAVQETRLESVYSKPICELSKGFRQRVGLAQAIIHKPEILLLDEPTEGLDPNQRVEIRNLIKNLGSSRTVILSTHVLQEVSATCNRVMILHRGKIVADGSVEDLMRQTEGKKVISLEIEPYSGFQDEVVVLRSVEGIVSVKEVGRVGNRVQYVLESDSNEDVRPKFFDLAIAHHWRIWELHQETLQLEDVFRELTST